VLVCRHASPPLARLSVNSRAIYNDRAAIVSFGASTASAARLARSVWPSAAADRVQRRVPSMRIELRQQPSQSLDARPDADTLSADCLAHQLWQVAIVFVGKVRFRHDGDLGVGDPREESALNLTGRSPPPVRPDIRPWAAGRDEPPSRGHHPAESTAHPV
jgi:hypothetical protein